MNPIQLPARPGLEMAGLSATEIIQLLFHNKWKITGLALVCGLGATLYAYSKPPTYKAAATLLIEPRENKAVQVQEVYDPGVDSNNYYMTQLSVIRSRSLAEKVVQRLELTQHAEFQTTRHSSLGGFWSEKFSAIDWRKWLPFLPAQTEDAAPAVTAEADAKARFDRAVSGVLFQTAPEPVPRTQLIRINFTAHSPELAASVANALADAYIEFGLEARLEASKKATKWLAEKLADIRTSLEKSELGLQNFREQQKILNVGGARGLLGDELIDNSRRLRESQKIRTDLSSTYTKIKQAGNDTRKLEQISDLLRLPLVQSAKSNLLTALESLKQLQQRYGLKHPQLASALTRVEAAERTFRDQLLLAVQNIKTEYEIASENERILGGLVESGKTQIRSLDRKEYEQSVLERDVTSNKQLYDLFLVSFKTTDSSSTYEPINVRILEPAMVPDKIFEPSIRSFATKGTILGFLLGIALVFAGQALDQTVRSPEELELITNLPVISIVPRLPPVLGSRKSLPKIFTENPRTSFAEGIRSIRASLKLNDVDKSYKRIVVISSVAGEGKSSIAGCLAMAFASGEKVLLLEGDLRAPTIRKLFGIPKTTPGLMELLTGEATLDKCLYLHEPSQAHILSVARIAANPSEVINSAAFGKLIGFLSEKFDRIIIDSPPCQAASDSLVLAKMADVALFVVKADSTRRRAVSAAVRQLNQVKAHIVGTVLNEVSPRKNPNYADSYYYAHKYYG